MSTDAEYYLDKKIGLFESCFNNHLEYLDSHPFDPNLSDVFDEYDKDRSEELKEIWKPLDDLIRSNPQEPIFYFKKNHSFYQTFFDLEHPGCFYFKKISPKIIPLNTWVVESASPDVGIHLNQMPLCKRCDRPYPKFQPNQQYCIFCQMRNKEKKSQRSCLHCHKPLPTKYPNRKYCSGACRTADCRSLKRKLERILNDPDE